MKFIKTLREEFSGTRISSKWRVAALLGVAALSFNGEAFAWGGSGTTSNPYTISTSDDLIRFRDMVNVGRNGICGKVTADIEVTGKWEPIGNVNQHFTGNFDGQGFEIKVEDFVFSELESNCPDDTTMEKIMGIHNGFFGISEGVITNVNLCINNKGRIKGNVSGGICAYNKGLISNCTMDYYKESQYNTLCMNAHCHVQGFYAGGIVGYNDKGVVRNCQTNVEIGSIAMHSNLTEYKIGIIGGICGCNNSGEITSCQNDNDISDVTLYGGGICGESVNGHSQAPVISGCINKGYVTKGGICGYNEGTISDCENHGVVTGSGICDSNIGGCIYRCTNYGQIDDLHDYLYEYWRLYYEYNYEPKLNEIERKYEIFEKSNVAGICGVNSRDSLGNGGKVYDCVNLGEVYGYEKVGGIIGYNKIEKNGQEASCYNNTNKGNVRGFRNVGGICGHQEGFHPIHRQTNPKVAGLGISDCDNSGEINGYENVGGICGMSEFKGILKCQNSGTVHMDSISNAGGICGYLNGDAFIQYCSNTGAIQGDNQVGGICGYAFGNRFLADTARVIDCYNWGNLIVNSKKAERIGGIVGAIDQKAEVKYCYNIGEIPTDFEETDGVCGYVGDDSNVYHCFGENNASLKNGEACYKLQDNRETMIWGQRIDRDPYPVLCLNGENEHLYKVYLVKAVGGGRSVYVNENTLEEVIQVPFPAYPGITAIYGGTGEIVIEATRKGTIQIIDVMSGKYTKTVTYKVGTNHFKVNSPRIYSVAGKKITVK